MGEECTYPDHEGRSEERASRGVRGTDGTLTDGGGFGAGAFTIRVTGVDGRVVTDTFPSFKGGDVLVGGQFP